MDVLDGSILIYRHHETRNLINPQLVRRYANWVLSGGFKIRYLMVVIIYIFGGESGEKIRIGNTKLDPHVYDNKSIFHFIILLFSF